MGYLRVLQSPVVNAIGRWAFTTGATCQPTVLIGCCFITWRVSRRPSPPNEDEWDKLHICGRVTNCCKRRCYWPRLGGGGLEPLVDGACWCRIEAVSSRFQEGPMLNREHLRQNAEPPTVIMRRRGLYRGVAGPFWGNITPTCR
jgi:hypothetical protein